MSPRKRTYETPKTQTGERLIEFFGNEKFSVIGAKIGLSKNQTGRQLQGISEPTIKTLKYIARNGGDVNYILTGRKKELDFEKTNDDYLNKLLNTWSILSNEQKGQLAGKAEDWKQQIHLKNHANKSKTNVA